MRSLCLALIALARLLPAGQLPFRLFNTEDGLVRNWIERIRTDSHGYLWFCTVEGISIFDGSQFTNLTVKDGLPNRLVHDVVEMASGDYWIATDGGVSRFRSTGVPGNMHFENFSIARRADANRVEALMEDSRHVLWIGTEEGLFRADTSGKQVAFEEIHLRPGVSPSIGALLEDSAHRIWAGGIDGVYLQTPDGHIDHLGSLDGIPLAVKAILRDKEKLWVAGEGLAVIDSSAKRPVVQAHYSLANGHRLKISSLYRNPANGEIWIGGHGLTRFHPEANTETRFEELPGSPVLKESDIMAIGSDAAGNVWAGVSTLGAIRIANYPTESYNEADGLESAVVVGMTEDRRGRFYAITGGGHTLNELAAGKFEPRVRRAPAWIRDLGWGQGSVVLQDRRGEWWAASAYGVLHYRAVDDPRELASIEPQLYTRRDGLPGGAILRLFEDSRGRMWAGTSAGFAAYDRLTGYWNTFETVRDPVHAIAEDLSGAIWAGFASSRLLRIRDGSPEEIAQGRIRGFVNVLLVDHLGRLWIGSSQGGLLRIDDPGASRPHVEDFKIERLSSSQIFSLAEDRFGRLYIAGGHGVDRLDLATGAIRHFSEANGLPRGETERLYRDKKGSIWFASNFGVSRFDPRSEEASAPAPTPLLRHLGIGTSEYPLSVLGTPTLTGLELTPKNTYLEIGYRAIHFDATGCLRYQHRLRGASEEWSTPTSDQTVRFANLASGNYTFEVRSMKDDGGISAPAELEFRLLPPIWRRAWFLALTMAILAAAAVVLHRYRLYQALMVERLRARLAIDLHDDLGAGLAEIAILSEVGRRRPGGAQDVLDQVARRARGLRSTLGDIVWTVDPRKDRLQDLILRMREIAFNMLETEDCRVRFVAPAENSLGEKELSVELRRHLLLFFKETVTNVARHAAATEVDLELSIRNGELRTRISDNGRGFDPGTPADGRGLTSLRTRAFEMRGILRIASAPSSGTEIELRVPLAKKQLPSQSGRRSLLEP
jgi:ligand-binding sensor domain-containing protein/signal transduction histidine kinase